MGYKLDILIIGLSSYIGYKSYRNYPEILYVYGLTLGYITHKTLNKYSNNNNVKIEYVSELSQFS